MDREGLRILKSVSSGFCLGSHSSWKGPCTFEFLRIGAGPVLFDTYICFKKQTAPPSAGIYRTNGEIKCGCAQVPVGVDGATEVS